MANALFGTDGIRGIANEGLMTAEMALRIGRAAGQHFQEEDRPHRILIGKDTRESGYMLENALTAGLCSMGVDVQLVGPLPTPGVSYIMRSLRADGAIMISASHNPYHYNGIKFFDPDGFKLPDEIERKIERLVLEPEEGELKAGAGRIGRARRIDDATGRYIEFAKATFPKGMRLDGLRIVCDCAHGAAYKVGPYALTELGADVVAIAHEPNGRNINEKCGSVHPQDMRATVIRERANLGIAFDGDGDRVVMADEDGKLLDGNAILAILATDMIERGVLPKKTIVSTIMANVGLERALEPLGGSVIRTDVGDRYVVEAMREQGLLVGGEASGHVVMLEHNTTGDALITALHALATMIRKGRSLAELATVYQALPEANTSVPINGADKPSEGDLRKICDEAREQIGDKGRVVVRPSGTEPIIRVMVQHDVLSTARNLAQELAKKISSL